VPGLEEAPQLSPLDPVDFLMHPAEIARGRRAAENYLSSFRSEELRNTAEEALETLATVISGGKCDSLAFPWQQVRPFHGAATLTILRQKGAPARIEALRCRRDSTRSYRMVPDSFPPRQVQKIRNILDKVLAQCCELGFVRGSGHEAPPIAEAAPHKPAPRKTSKRSSAGRSLSTGELRALIAKSSSRKNAEGLRDAVFFSFVYRGLKIAEITALTLDSVGVTNSTGRCKIVTRPKSGGRGRRLELTNEELIHLEDWLDMRGGKPGPLLCTVGRGTKIEGKRITTAVLNQICEARAQEARVQPFRPNDLSRTAEGLTEHRKATRRKAAKHLRNVPSALEALLFEDAEAEAAAEREASHSEMIRFPFLGLGS
jgi:integrase